MHGLKIIAESTQQKRFTAKLARYWVLGLAVACISTGVARADGNKIDASLRTTGINTDLLHPEKQMISSLTLDFSVSADLGGQAVVMGVTMPCGSGCIKPSIAQTVSMTAADGTSQPAHSYTVVINRFASAGTSLMPDNTKFTWLVRMVEGQTLRGTLVIPTDAQGHDLYPGKLALSGKMSIDVQATGLPPLHLLSFNDSYQAGTVKQWPPRETELHLTPNQHVPYYTQENLDKLTQIFNQSGRDSKEFKEAELKLATLVVTGNKVQLHSDKSMFLTLKPKIQSITPVLEPVASTAQPPLKVAGAQLQWDDAYYSQQEAAANGCITCDQCCPIDDFIIYRNTTPDADVNAWEQVGTVPAVPKLTAKESAGAALLNDSPVQPQKTVYKWTDKTWDGTTDARYVIIHTTRLSFGYDFQGFADKPVEITAIR